MTIVKFDEGKFVNDLRSVVEDAVKRQPSLIVVPTEKEVATFERNFSTDLRNDAVWCVSFADYYNGSWRMISPMPKFVIGFRVDDLYNNLAGDAMVVYMTVKRVNKFNKNKEEGTNDEA